MSVVIAHYCDQFSIIATETRIYSVAYQGDDIKLYSTPFGYCSGVGLRDDILRVVNAIKKSETGFEMLVEKVSQLRSYYTSCPPAHNSYITLTLGILSRETFLHKLALISVEQTVPHLSFSILDKNRSHVFAPSEFFDQSDSVELIERWENESKSDPDNLPFIMKQMASKIEHISNAYPQYVSTLCCYGINTLGNSNAYKIEAKQLYDIYDQSNDTIEFFENLFDFRISNESKSPENGH